VSITAEQHPLWEPSREQREQATLTRFMRWVGEREGRSFADYEELWRWSVDELERFWAAVWEFCDVRCTRAYDRVLAARAMPGARWFEGAQLNYAENVMHGRDLKAVAVLHASETRELSSMSWGQLHEQVAEVAGGLRSLGVGRGDRVVAYMPNVPETLIGLLAVSSIGAVWSSAAPEFGVRSVIDRFAQIEPTVLLAVDGYRYGGRDYDRLEALGALARELPTLKHTVVLPYLSQAPDLGGLSDVHRWDELRRRGAGRALEFEAVPFEHPLWVLYSSGTTGLPKAIVQGHGGILLEQLKQGLLHLDLQRGDRMFWFTTTGWMMWNFLVGCLLTDAAIVMYDGNPAHPDLGVLWDLAERTQMTCLGTSAGYLSSCRQQEISPTGEGRRLEALRSVGSTGSPLPPEGFEWVYASVKSDLWLFSTSGGTDVCTAFVGGCPLLPVYEGELQCRALGCAVEAWDEQGQSVVDEVGELVICEPMPSMPLYLWGDTDGERYRESYFDVYPGVWRHGDWVRINDRGGVVIYGRSDSTINRGGVRMGTSEIYRAVLAVPEVLDALVVDVPRSGGESWMPLFVVLRDGLELDQELAATIRRRVREDCSPRHVPNDVLAIEEVPRTLSGKVLEVPVKKILMGTEPQSAAAVDSLANPASLDYFVRLASERPD